MSDNPIKDLRKYGQSPWLDFLSRDLIESGKLAQLVDEGLGGVTSNPAIFKKAIADGTQYDDTIRDLATDGASTEEIYEKIVVTDIQRAADILRSRFVETGGGDGFVSLEVSPHLARDTNGTIQEARHLWEQVARPNVFIKVPGTKEGLPALTQLICDGINVNVTLLFGLGRYAEVIDGYMAGLEKRSEVGLPLDSIASVASFFLSRIDVLVDPTLENLIKGGGEQALLAEKIHGQVAIASAKLAYQIFKGYFSGHRFKELEKERAQIQRVLWASTSTKNPNYSDIKYIEPLIGAHSVNTMPMETLEAYRDHGAPDSRIENELDVAEEVVNTLEALDIDLDAVTQQLEDEGIDKFIEPYDALLESIEAKRKEYKTLVTV